MWQIRGGTLDKMLIVIPEKKVIYTVVPKAANSMIKYCLWEACGSPIEIIGIHSISHQSGGPARRVSDISNRELANMIKSEDWYKFSFVRNPYSRLISAYKDKILGMGIRKNTKPFLKKINWKGNEPPTIDEFIRTICQQNADSMDWHWMPQNRLLMKEIIKYDFIGKLEDFNADMESVLTELNVPAEKARELLAKSINASIDKVKDPIEISESSARMFYEYFKEDFELFGYDYESYK